MAQERKYDPDEGTFSSVKPQIPEPMVFDLIRPLGAERGEFEANSLFRYTPSERPRRLLWAPEVEYAFLEGYGVEFELPMENGRIANWKGALQGTLPRRTRSFIHGWQTVGEVSESGDFGQVDALYLAGVRWNADWSIFTMTGIRRELGETSGTAMLGNYSLFYHHNDAVTYGIETNYKGKAVLRRGMLVMPQLQFRRHRLNIQIGTGWRWNEGQNGLQIGWRISREF